MLTTRLGQTWALHWGKLFENRWLAIKKGIKRYGTLIVPLEEALSSRRHSMFFSLVVRLRNAGAVYSSGSVGGFDVDLFSEILPRLLSSNAKVTGPPLFPKKRNPLSENNLRC